MVFTIVKVVKVIIVIGVIIVIFLKVVEEYQKRLLEMGEVVKHERKPKTPEEILEDLKNKEPIIRKIIETFDLEDVK